VSKRARSHCSRAARSGARLALALLLVTTLGGGLLSTQSQRTPTTLAALDAYASFFHRRQVVVQAVSEGEFQNVFVTDGPHRIRALNVAPPVDGETELLEIDGTYWDVGRLQPNDPRLDQYPIAQLSQELLGKPWPASGELPLLIADETRRARLADTTTLRAIAIAPQDYRDQQVTVTGRFRGRNLFGDQPEAPGASPHDFVLLSGNASLWVVGTEPKGRDFELDIMARVDTSRWLEVTGTVTGTDQLISIEAEALALAERPSAPAPVAISTERDEPRPPAEVIFSAPTPDDIDVPVDSLVRVQFSRDMDGDTFNEQVAVSYLGADDDAPPLEFELSYRPRNRVLNISFVEPLEAYRSVEVTFSDKIMTRDGATLVPYTLSFSTGGS